MLSKIVETVIDAWETHPEIFLYITWPIMIISIFGLVVVIMS